MACMHDCLKKCCVGFEESNIKKREVDLDEKCLLVFDSIKVILFLSSRKNVS